MIIEQKNLQKVHVYKNFTDSAGGRLSKAFIDPNTGKVIAYKFRFKNLYLSPQEIAFCGPKAIFLNENFEYNSLEDLPKLKKLIESKQLISHQKVVTEEGDYIGKVNDLLVSLKLHALDSLFVYYMGKGLFIPKSQIIEILPDKIIIKNPGQMKRLKNLIKKPVLTPA